MQKPLNQTWDLDSIFPGGSDSQAYAEYLDRLDKDIADFRAKLGQVQLVQQSSEIGHLVAAVEAMQDIWKRIKEADAFAGCLTAQNQADKKAVLLSGRNKTLYAAFLSSLTEFDQLLTNIPDSVWRAIVAGEALRGVAFPLEERRTLALEKLPPEQEALVNDLAVDGYHGWGELYNTAVSRMKIPFEQNGKTESLSAGQAANKLFHPDRNVRAEMFGKWEKAWSEQSDFCSDALNHLSGFRLQLYKHRGWKSVHKEPLEMNRMTEKTLTVMWDVIDRNKGMLLEYMQRKAQLLGLEKLGWHDVDAPIGSATMHISYDEAAEMIVEQFRKFSPKLADFAVSAFERRWIEAEDRSGKRPGGFCTSFPVSNETRIFMTYSGTASNVSTLAHELGHAYHQHVMSDLPALAQDYAMNVAETASTFAEMIVSDAAVKQAENEEERLALLEDKIQRSVAFLMNIHARFIFETNFYEARKDGLVSIEQLNQMMEDAQKKAYHEVLSEYHPHFWASKLHFYLTDVPFYNFPYTFGYLFSAGIYALALKEGQSFEDKYVSLLRDTASMTVEDLARKHLDVDLTEPEFWQSAVDLVANDVKQFLEMTEQK